MSLSFPGWRLIGAFPDGDIPGDVGAWLLVDGDQAALLEVPEGLTVEHVRQALSEAGATLRYVLASHDHWDHLDRNVWGEAAAAFPQARLLHPAAVRGDHHLSLGDEDLWLIAAPKHSLYDVVTIFRGVAMTGDIELGTLASVTDEVPLRTRRRSLEWLAGFPGRKGYHIHSLVSAHLNDARSGFDWPTLVLPSPAASAACV